MPHIPLTAIAAGLVSGVLLTSTVAANRVAKNPSLPTVSATFRNLRIVDAHGRTTAFIGNVADGSSPAILLYDRQGRVCSAVMVDSVTGEAVPIMPQLSAVVEPSASDLTVRGLVRHRRTRHI